MSQRRAWSLRWLIGGIYFFIMVTILGTLALYFSYRITGDYMAALIRTRSGQASLAADLLVPIVKIFELDRERLHLLAGTNTPAMQHALDDLITRPDLLRGLTADALAPRVRPRHGITVPQLLFLLRDLGNTHRTITFTLRSIYKRTTPVRRVTVLKLDGTVIADTPPFTSDPAATAFTPEVLQALDIRGEGIGVDIRYNPHTAEETLYIAVPIEEKHDQAIPPSAPLLPGEVTTVHRRLLRLGVLVLATPVSEVRGTITNIKIAIALAFLAGMLILFFVNAGISHTISSPLAILSQAAGRFAGGHFNEQVAVSGAAEVVSLGDSFNRMARHLRLTITRLAEERAQAEAILASMVDGVLVTDMQGTVLLMNRSAEQIAGMTESTVVGRPLADTDFPADLSTLLDTLRENGIPVTHEMTFTQPEERVVEVHMAPVDVEERHLGIVIVLYDITTQRKLEIIRRDFVANVSHELRTPVASIRAMAESLHATNADDPQTTMEFLGTIIEESERLTALLNDLLQLSRIESGRHLITPGPIDLCAIIRQVAAQLMVPLSAKRQQLHLELPAAIIVLADRNALVQILLNLLDNARKYTPEGGVITVQADADTMAHLRITDTGFGIPAEDLDRIYERFYRVDKARSREQGGTGLGLSIVKHLVEMHEGRITVRSEVGVGTTFTVLLPLAADRSEEAGELPAALPASASDG